MIASFCNWLWGTSLRRQLVFLVAIVYLALMAAFAAYLITSQRTFLRERARADALARSELLAASCLHGVLATDLAGLQEIVQTLHNDRTLRFAMVLDTQGRVLAHTDPKKAGLFLKDETSLKLLKAGASPQILAETGDTLDIATPIDFQGRIMGWARLSRDLTGVNIHLRTLTRTGVFFAIVAIAIGTLIASVVGRSVLKPLQLLLHATERVARDELDYRAPITTRNEVGVVTAAFNNALDQLCRQMAERQKSEALLREQTRQIMESANILATATGEIVSAATQMASAASDSASALAQTSATVVEVRQTVHTASERAKQVAAAARQTEEISKIGKKSTEDSVEGMRHIRQQMESIADNMTRLSEQTQAIGQIIATVDDMAAQSNLLAVNAAIEAAKAGEQGRGFTVVAHEVKNLAEQSRQATEQVRTILADIQKATNTAVLATKQGTKAVETGVKQSAQAGASILALTGSVAQSAQSATLISASSQEQLVGMDQVALAMTSIKQASEQSLASVKHLESSARGLNELGRKLQQLVETCKI